MATVVQSPEVTSPWSETARLVSSGWIAPVCVLVLAPLPFVAFQAQLLWERPHYQFFPFVPLCAALLAWRDCRRLGPLRTGQGRTVALLASLSWLVLALASFLVSAWLASVAALLIVAAAIATIGGWTLLRPLLPAWAFLGLAVGLPLNIDQDLIGWLQALTSRVSSLLLDRLGVFHVMEGNVVRVADRAFGVEEACSGIYSLFSVMFCTLFFLLWARRGPIRALLTLAAAAGWVVAGNIVRVVAMVFLATRRDVDVSQGWRHEVLSLLVFSATLLLIASTDCLLDFWPALVRAWRAPRAKARGGGKSRGQSPTVTLPAPPPEPRSALDLGSPTRLPCLRATWLCSRTAAVSFASLGVVQMIALIDVPHWQRANTGRLGSLKAASITAGGLNALQSGSLPARSGNFVREDFKTETRFAGSSLGEMSRYWRYRFGDSAAVVSVDFPFEGWHELSTCYRGQGWTIVAREHDPDRAAGDGDGGQPSVVAARLAKGPGQHGYLLFCLFDQAGNTVEPVGQNIGSLFRSRCAFWLNLWPGNRGARSSPGSPLLCSYQVQLLIESEYPLTAAEEDAARAFFREALAAIGPQGSDADAGAGGIGS